MHENRIKYSLSQYQKVLINRSKSFALILQDQKTMETFFFKPKLKSIWEPSLAKNYRNKLLSKLIPVLNKSVWKFVTLTYSLANYTIDQAFSLHKKDINRFFKQLRKEYKKFRYFYVVELTKKGMVHFHCLIEDKFSARFIKHTWKKITGNIIVDVKNIKPGNVIYYVTKYATKLHKDNNTIAELLFKNVSRLFIFSRNWSEGITGEEKEKKFSFLAFFHIQQEELKEFFSDVFGLYSLEEVQQVFLKQKLRNVTFVDKKDRTHLILEPFPVERIRQ